MDVETAFRQLIKVIDSWPGSTGYVTPTNLKSALQMALVPLTGAGFEYPKMLYRGQFSEEQTCVVQDAAEEADALAKGWHREPAKQPPTEFPEFWVEITAPYNPSAKRVMLRNASDKRTFLQITDDAKGWMRDSSRGVYGGTPVGLDQLVQEHAAALHKQLDEELQQPPPSPPGFDLDAPPEVEPDTLREGKEQ